MINRWLLTAMFFFALAFIALAPACRRDTEQERIKKVIQKIQKAAEEKDVRSILDQVSRTYADPQGNNRDGIKDLLLIYFFRYPAVSVYITGLEISIDGTAGSAKFQTVLSGKKSEGAIRDILPEALGVYGFEVTFMQEKGEWKVMSAKWERLGDAPGTS